MFISVKLCKFTLYVFLTFRYRFSGEKGDRGDRGPEGVGIEGPMGLRGQPGMEVFSTF